MRGHKLVAEQIWVLVQARYHLLAEAKNVLAEAVGRWGHRLASAYQGRPALTMCLFWPAQPAENSPKRY